MDTDSATREVLRKLRRFAALSRAEGLYGDRAKALADIDAALAASDAWQVKLLLAPTGNLQELSISSGWGEEFCAMAAELDRILVLDEIRGPNAP